MNWVDILIGGSFLIGFAAGITGRGILGLSLPFAAAVVSAGVGYILAGDLTRAGFVGNKWAAGAAVFVVVFLAFLTSGRMLKKIPGARGRFQSGGCVYKRSCHIRRRGSCRVCGGAGERKQQRGAEQSVLYPKAAAVLNVAGEKYGDFRPSEEK